MALCWQFSGFASPLEKNIYLTHGNFFLVREGCAIYRMLLRQSLTNGVGFDRS